MSPTPHPHHRTRVTRADDAYPLGQPPPALRIEAGEVVSVEAESCTVLMFGETVSGVVFLADPPAVGDAVEVWEADDLLWTPGYADGSTGGSDAAHLVSRTRPAAVDMPVPIGGSFRDDSWFFEALDQPDWADAAREDLSGVEVTSQGADNDATLWSGNAFDVKPGDALTFHVTATHLSGTAGTAQATVCYGPDDTDPLPTTETAVASYGTPVLIDGIDDEVNTTWTVPATVVTVDNPVLVPLRARVGIRLRRLTAGSLSFIGSTFSTGATSSLALPAGTLPGDLLVLGLSGKAGASCADARITTQQSASSKLGGYGLSTSSTAPVAVSLSGDTFGGAAAVLATYRTTGNVVSLWTGALAMPGSGTLSPSQPTGADAGITVLLAGIVGITPTPIGADSTAHWVTDSHHGSSFTDTRIESSAVGNPAGTWGRTSGGDWAALTIGLRPV